MQAPDQVGIGHSKWGGCDCSLCPMRADDGISGSLFGCHITDSDVAPGFNNRYGEGVRRGGGLCVPYSYRPPFIVLCGCHAVLMSSIMLPIILSIELCLMTTNENIICLLFDCHVTDSDMASSLMVS
jgi:hypothetical protein